MKTLLKNANIITCDGGKVISGGCMGYENGKILFVGEIPEGFRADEVINAKGNTVMPGLVNAHSHVAMTALRSYSEGYKLQEWLNDKIFPIEAKLLPEHIYIFTMLGIAESLKFGTTLISDCYYFMDRAAEAYLETGLNANISRCVMNPVVEDYSKDYRMREAVELYEKYDGKGGIKVEMFPHAVYTCTEKYLALAAETAKKYNMPIASHLCENLTEVTECREKYGVSPVEVYKKAGLLSESGCFAHCVVLDDEDIASLKGHSVVHNPVSNLKLGSGIADIYKYKESGINIALGTDGASSNNNLNMFEEIKLAALLMSGKRDPSLVNPAEIIEMATVNGAKALKREKKGMLKEGFDADYIILNSSDVHHIPNHNIVNNAVYSALGSDVLTTVCNGRVLYHKGEYKTVDVEYIEYEITKIKKELF